jgi:hypothetical protein
LNHLQSRNNTGGINNMNSNYLQGQGTQSMLHNQTVYEVSNTSANNSKIQNVQINLHKDTRGQSKLQGTQAKDGFNMMKTFTNVQHAKSNSMSYNISNLPMNQQGVPSNFGNYLNVNNKKVQPKIVKNVISRINPINCKISKFLKNIFSDKKSKHHKYNEYARHEER